MLLQFLIMGVKITEFIWQDICIRYKVKILFTKAFLHANHVIAESILAGNFIRLRVMINFLVFIKTFIDIGLARAA